MGQAAKGSCNEQMAAMFQQATQLMDCGYRVRYVFEDLSAHDRIERLIGLRDVGDVADDVERPIVKRPCLKS